MSAVKAQPLRIHKPKPGGVAPKYPWKSWITSKGTILTKGKDYQCSTDSLIVYAYNRQGKLNRKAREAKSGKELHLMLIRLDDNHVYIRLKKSADRDSEAEERIRQQFHAAKALLKSQVRKSNNGSRLPVGSRKRKGD